MAPWDDETCERTIDHVERVTLTERNRAHLVVLAGGPVGEMYDIAPGGSIIGRGAQVGIRLDGESVSRNHARIWHDGGRVWLEDLGSRNGTAHNGTQVSAPVALDDGDKIQIGSAAILKFSLGDNLDEHFHRMMYDSALRDGLTRVFNRRYFDERLLAELRFCARHRAALSLLLLDVDHFKRVNDEYGHVTGDRVLQVFAASLQANIRNEDVLARFGGEELAIISRGISVDDAVRFAERLRRHIEATVIESGSHRFRVTMSIGVAAISQVPDAAPADLIAAADQALYAAKAQGRNRVVAYQAP